MTFENTLIGLVLLALLRFIVWIGNKWPKKPDKNGKFGFWW